MKILKSKTNPVYIAVLLGSIAFASSGKAAMITPPLNTFVLTNTSADGLVDIANNGLSFVLTGGNTGSGIPGNTDFTTTAQSAGTVQFPYSYSSLDTPGNDIAGYLLGKTRFALADADGLSGSASFTLSAGQTYGWYVSTLDNTGEPGILTVAFSPGSPVPEPADFALTFLGVATLAITRSRWIRAQSYQKEAK